MKFIKDIHGHCARCKRDRWLSPGNLCKTCERAINAILLDESKAKTNKAKPQMTRRDIEREYSVNQSGVIYSRGKFEGEPIFAPYFWDLAMAGDADQESDEYEYTFNINADQRRLFPELGKAREITLVEHDNGNVATTTRE